MENTGEKKRITLDARLQKCADFVRAGVRVADVGTDHGYLPIALLQGGRIISAVAADVNAAPLESAVRNAARFGVSDRMRCVLSDGLAGLSAADADDVVIAGMGGELILRIVAETPWLRTPEKHLVLQPMTTADRLRAGLYAAGFAIDREEAVYDGRKIYTVLSVFYTGEAQTALPLRMLHMGGDFCPEALIARGMRRAFCTTSRTSAWACGIWAVTRRRWRRRSARSARFIYRFKGAFL